MQWALYASENSIQVSSRYVFQKNSEVQNVKHNRLHKKF